MAGRSSRASRVTLEDVAKAAGVGKATASRALSSTDRPDINEETRERIRAIADRLGYRPSVTARTLSTGDYHALSVVVPDDAWGWWEPVVRAAVKAAENRGYKVLVHSVAGRGVAAAIEELASVPTEGVIVCGDSAGDAVVVAVAEQARLPIVAIDDVSRAIRMPTISVDSVNGAKVAVQHLLETGRKRIAYVGSSLDARFVDDRRRGYREALEEAGIAFDERLVIMAAHWDDEAHETLDDIEPLLVDHRLDAVFCEFDLLAAPVIRTLRRAGLRVPEEVAIMGFDDERAAQLLDPQLSTVRQPYDELGERATAMLLDRISGRTAGFEREHVQPTLRIRASTPRSSVLDGAGIGDARRSTEQRQPVATRP